MSSSRRHKKNPKCDPNLEKRAKIHETKNDKAEKRSRQIHNGSCQL